MKITDNNELIINGKKYIQNPKRESKSYLLSTIFKAYDYYTGYYGRELNKINIITEFELIQQKESKLSKSIRDWVESQFNKHFIEIK